MSPPRRTLQGRQRVGPELNRAHDLRQLLRSSRQELRGDQHIAATRGLTERPLVGQSHVWRVFISPIPTIGEDLSPWDTSTVWTGARDSTLFAADRDLALRSRNDRDLCVRRVVVRP